MDRENGTISLPGITVKQITCVLILHFLVVRTCSTTTAGHRLSPFSILLTHPYHKLLSLAPSELFCELCQSSGAEVRDMSYSFPQTIPTHCRVYFREVCQQESHITSPRFFSFPHCLYFSLWSVHMCLWQYLSGPAKWVAGPVAS